MGSSWGLEGRLRHHSRRRASPHHASPRGPSRAQASGLQVGSSAANPPLGHHLSGPDTPLHLTCAARSCSGACLACSVPSVSGCLPTGPLSPRPRRLVVVVVVAVVAVLCCGLCWPWEPPGQWRPGRTAGPHSSHESRVPICSAGAQLRPSTRHRAGPPQRRCSSRSRPGTRCQGS